MSRLRIRVPPAPGCIANPAQGSLPHRPEGREQARMLQHTGRPFMGGADKDTSHDTRIVALGTASKPYRLPHTHGQCPVDRDGLSGIIDHPPALRLIPGCCASDWNRHYFMAGWHQC